MWGCVCCISFTRFQQRRLIARAGDDDLVFAFCGMVCEDGRMVHWKVLSDFLASCGEEVGLDSGEVVGWLVWSRC